MECATRQNDITPIRNEARVRVRFGIQVSRTVPKSIRSLIQELVATPQTASFCERGNRAHTHTPTYVHRHRGEYTRVHAR